MSGIRHMCLIFKVYYAFGIDLRDAACHIWRPINQTHAFDELLIYKPFKQHEMFVLLNPIHYVDNARAPLTVHPGSPHLIIESHVVECYFLPS